MRKSTREKLFNEGECRELWEHEGKFGIITCCMVSGSVVMIHDYPAAKDGFEVYVKSPGNSLNVARVQMGLQEYCDIRSQVGKSKGKRCVKLAGHFMAHQWDKSS